MSSDVSDSEKSPEEDDEGFDRIFTEELERELTKNNINSNE